jgi:hypothetical protein
VALESSQQETSWQFAADVENVTILLDSANRAKGESLLKNLGQNSETKKEKLKESSDLKGTG